MNHVNHEHRLLFARWVLVLTLVGGALALGSLHTVVLCVEVALLGAAAVLAWFGAEPQRLRPSAKLLLVTGVGLTLWTALQTVPLPIPLLSLIAPANADVWARALSPLREAGPSWAPLSLDPIATRVQVLRGVGYVLAFVVTLRVAHDKRGAIFLERALVASSVIMALAAMLHPVVGATRVFGVYDPVHKYAYVANHVAPLLNQNHLVAYLNLGTCVGLGGLFSSRRSMNVVLGAACVIVVFVVARWEGSRGGTIAIVAGLFMVVVMSRASRGVARTARTVVYMATFTALLGLGFLVLGSATGAYVDLSSTDVSKATLAKQALAMIASFPLFGIGRGAFEAVFPAFRYGTGYWSFTHPENVIPQWLVEWGVPIALAAFLAVGWALRPSTALARSRPAVGPWAALVCLGLHNLVDYNSEVPAVMLALSVCAGMVVAGSAGVGDRRAARAPVLAGSVVAAGAVSAAAIAIVLAAFGIPNELGAEQARLHDRVIDATAPPLDVVRELRGSMLRHPADPYFPYLGAVRASLAKDASPIPWIGRALERSPVFGRAHLLLGRELARRSPAQARLEYRLAIEQDRDIVRLAEIPRLIEGYDDAMELVPAGAARDTVIDALASGVQERLPATSARLDRLVITGPHLAAASEREAQRAGDELAADDAAPWCVEERARCVERALRGADALIEAQPSQCRGFALRAELLVRYGDAAEGLRRLEAAADGVSDRAACYGRLLDLALLAHDTLRANAAIERMARAGCSADAECATMFFRLAQTEQARGNGYRAVGFMKMAMERAPEDEALVLASARLQSSLGLHAESARAYGVLARRHPEQVEWRDREAFERAAASKGRAAPPRGAR